MTPRRLDGKDATTEVVVDVLDDMYMWRAARAGVTLFGTRVGRVLLTTERFLFLSTGSGLATQLPWGAFRTYAPISAGQTRTDQLNLGALQNKGSLNIRLDRITAARVERRWDLSHYLVVEISAAHDAPPVCSFMTRYGFNPGTLAAFVDTLEWARTRGKPT